MNTPMTWGELLMIAFAVVLLVQAFRGQGAGPTPQQLRAQRQLDAIMEHLGLPEPAVSRPGALSPQVLALIKADRPVEAMRRYRQETGESLKQAQAAVAFERHGARASD